MGAITKIEWTDHTFNPWRGCQHATDEAGEVHPACEHCYAESMSRRNPGVLGKWGDEPSGGTRVVASEATWRAPIKWDRDAQAAGERRRVFCASLADVFEDWTGPILDAKERQLFVDGDAWFAPGRDCVAMSQPVTMDDVRRRLFALIDATPNLDWLILTKRPENVRRMWPMSGQYYDDDRGECDTFYRTNVWLGTSVSDQATADEWIPKLLDCRDLAPVLFLSVEPLLGPVDLSGWLGDYGSLQGGPHVGRRTIDWVIVGSESGPHRRPMNIDWVREVRDQCANANVALFVKQMAVNGKVTGDVSGFPEDVRNREFPKVEART